jgi:hypothetical protein
MPKGKAWTKEQTDLAREMLARNAPNAEFWDALGRSKFAARDRMAREAFKAYRANWKAPVDLSLKTPPEVLADLESRKRSQRSLTAIILGDPEPCRRRF